jgi:hypothetical protein
MTSLNKSHTHRLQAVVIPNASGKTTLCQHLRQYQQVHANEHSFMDIDEFAQTYKDIGDLIQTETTKTLQLFPRLKEDIYQAVIKNPQTIVVIITSNVQLVDFLQIKPKRVKIFIPTVDLYVHTILPHILSSPSQENKVQQENLAAIQASREIILRRYATNLKLYGSFQELQDLFVKTFDLARRL